MMPDPERSHIVVTDRYVYGPFSIKRARMTAQRVKGDIRKAQDLPLFAATHTAPRKPWRERLILAAICLVVFGSVFGSLAVVTAMIYGTKSSLAP